MGWLTLTDDELALLRYTCDLFFAAESPIYYIDQECREPSDFEQAYNSLLEKKVIDPKTFRLTDKALNRLAPLSECDARIVITKETPGQEAEVDDFYLLDEIAVGYDDTDQGHMVGADQDPDQIINHIARRFSPRRSRGDFVQIDVSPGEYLVYALLAQDVRDTQEEDRMSLGEIVSALTDLGFSTPNTSQSAPPAPMRPHSVRTANDPSAFGNAPSAFGNANAPSAFGSHSAEETAIERPSYKSSLPSDPAWEKHISSLAQKGVLHRDKLGHPHLRPSFKELAAGLAERGRTSFVRYDFVDEEWLIRETSFLPVEGGLFFLGPTPEGYITIRELDQARLDLALRAAVGPLPPSAEGPGGGAGAGAKTAKDFLLRAKAPEFAWFDSVEKNRPFGCIV